MCFSVLFYQAFSDACNQRIAPCDLISKARGRHSAKSSGALFGRLLGCRDPGIFLGGLGVVRVSGLCAIRPSVPGLWVCRSFGCLCFGRCVNVSSKQQRWLPHLQVGKLLLNHKSSRLDRETCRQREEAKQSPQSKVLPRLLSWFRHVIHTCPYVPLLLFEVGQMVGRRDSGDDKKNRAE